MICAGIDAGSRMIKIVLMDSASRRVIAQGWADQGVEQERLARGLLEQLLRDNGAGMADVGNVVATGYGRAAVTIAGRTVTEITCQAVGVGRLCPQARTVIDIGGQDSKVIFLENSVVRDFVMNDRCAAGTGRFLEMVASRLGISIESLGRAGRASRKPAVISSTCAVFAESEIVGLLACGYPKEDIVAGVQKAVASRVRAMAGRGAISPVVLTGGVAMIEGMDAVFADVLGCSVSIAPQPQMTCALGAALLACDGAGA